MKLILSLFLITLISCISDENLDLQVNSKYQGDYSGDYSGDLSGKVILSVSNTGNIDGMVYYEDAVISSSESIYGYVMIDGKFNISTKSKLTFLGYLHDKSTKGKWVKDNLKGDFIFYKK